ncbi:MAG TPA: RcpC/CpaB family pilus assembly protein [Phycisphaerae bacterium]|nr:RcpC/CpaB family pilus assembly protein [Phycisphaerae bacterium]HPS53048.1 RcpC/CpaB family pilus assembly protein [Phycisphaerae bacterium]
MAEHEQQAIGVQNKWLILIALVLGILAAAVYNLHIKAIRDEYEGNSVKIIELRRDLSAGDRLRSDCIEACEIPATEAARKSFGNVIKWSQKDMLLVEGGKRVNQPVRKGQFLLWDHITGREGTNPSNRISDGMVLKSIEFDKSQSLGDALSAGDRVNLCGLFSLNGQPLQSYRIIEGVRVLNIGGKGAAVEGKSVGQSYNRITVEVPEEVSLRLDNVLTHMTGQIQLELRPYSAPAPTDININPLLGSLATQAVKGRTR